MRLFHLADLHIGKRVNGFSLLDDQRFVLDRVLDLIDEKSPDALVLAGDIYDTANPPERAVRELDRFLNEVAQRDVTTVMIGGNHDSSVRLSFASRLLAKSGIHISSEYRGSVEPVLLGSCATGDIWCWPVPFVRAAEVSSFMEPDAKRLSSTHEALAHIVREIERDARFAQAAANVLVAHQFVTAGMHDPETSDSENLMLGTLDSVDAALFDGFDYVALGHIHRPQRMGRDEVRYAGSPVMYSFSEMNRPKTMPVVDIDEKGVALELVLLAQLHDMREVTGTLEQIVEASRKESARHKDAYVQAILTNEEEPIGALDRLRAVYPNLMVLRYDNARTRALGALGAKPVQAITKEYPQLFSEFYHLQTGLELEGDLLKLAQDAFEQAFSEAGEAQ